MHVYCDQLAMTVLVKQKETTEHVPFLSASKVGLKIKNRHIKHHIPTQIQTLWNQEDQKKYVLTCQNLNNEIFKDID